MRKIQKIHKQKMTTNKKEDIIRNDITDDELTTEEIHNIQDKELYTYYNYSEYFLDNFCNIFMYCYRLTINTIRFILKISGVYLLWIFLHYFASHLYVKVCVPSTIIGFFISPFMTATPHCQGLRWIVYNAANIINNMWIILGAWICSTILIVNKDMSNENR